MGGVWFSDRSSVMSNDNRSAIYILYSPFLLATVQYILYVYPSISQSEGSIIGFRFEEAVKPRAVAVLGCHMLMTRTICDLCDATTQDTGCEAESDFGNRKVDWREHFANVTS